MLSSLLRPKKTRRRVQEIHSPFSSPYVDRSSPAAERRERLPRHASADFTETEMEEDTEEEIVLENNDADENGGGDEDELEEEDGDEDQPLLPIFSAAHLDALPVYNLTHAIRLIILPRTETTLTWDQLRSPQVSQFLVKPMQQQIRTSHFSRATLYALMANCLQFKKESQANPGNAGNSLTRALVCELLAIKLLKEYNTRELIDALSYDFFPLQGLAQPDPAITNWNQRNRMRPVAARISTLEVAIRASAKRLLAHPLVVQQLEAIWAGTIVFHSAADNLHRTSTSRTGYKKQSPSNGSAVPLLTREQLRYGATAGPLKPPNKEPESQQAIQTLTRRTVTLYDPRDASLFKLSRLRVPRYRQFFSTCSLAILLVLFLAVLSQRSTDITGLEVIFWFWSAGFMLDEVVGFNEQGFSLYIMSFWNAFDLGILVLLTIYYCMRLYGIFLVDYGREEWNSMAYDVLATNAILLFPRLFSVLDHYRYFSQLLIAFRLMAIDLVAVFVLILIACSGFFVAFTLSFGKSEYDAAGVAYKIFQILMGFTPAAWEAWETYNFLGKALLVLFLFICHFLVITILITVLTNSFMSIVSNANEEHQFVFAVNTISMVKNDALFSYVAPTNILAWVLTPFRFVFPFRTFIRMNRTVIKITHFPLLFSICAYEKIFLARSVFEPTDLVEKVGRRTKRTMSFQDRRHGLFSPNLQRHESSVAGFQKDRALDEVFRLTPRDTLPRNRPSFERRQTHNVINNWMEHQGEVASPPQEQDRSILERLEMRRQSRKATIMRHRGISRELSGNRSVASDPAEFISTGFHDMTRISDDALHPNSFGGGHTDADGDDELLTNDEDELHTEDKHTATNFSQSDAESEEDYFQTPTATRFVSPTPAFNAQQDYARQNGSPPKQSKATPRKKAHDRNLSTTTILFNPVAYTSSVSSISPPRSRPLTAKIYSQANTGTNTPAGPSGSRTPKTANYTNTTTRPRPILPNRANFQSIPNINKPDPARNRLMRHKDSSLNISLSEMGLEHAQLGAVPSSFQTQMAIATEMAMKRDKKEETADGMMGRLMLARMKTLEEGFAEVVKEFRGMRTAGNSSVENEPSMAKWREAKVDKKKKRPSSANLSQAKSEINVESLRMTSSKGKEKGYFDNNHGGGDISTAGLEVEGFTSRGTSEYKTPYETPDAGIIAQYLTKGNSL
ncbi:f0e7a120-99ba-474b-af5d-3371ab3f9f83 [Sclerotinia trifoliorum]|uniref:F0e7a120-99ba-474b-af5d-3371ab3f9f83 n=1 Tax=Sclerotinia trifoliorum TaxID=28548 RepID=A0A8H2ZS35_9HELO|nr:f0e7a120-99ba-474b-af5d-3371ab3f9f83 [Sclerotinia trifoliorum]